MYDTDTQRAYLHNDVLHGVGVVQHKGDGQMRPAQLIHLACKLDGGQGVTTQLGEAAAAICHVHSLNPQCQGGCLHSPMIGTIMLPPLSCTLLHCQMTMGSSISHVMPDRGYCLTLLNLVSHKHPSTLLIRACNVCMFSRERGSLSLVQRGLPA